MGVGKRRTALLREEDGAVVGAFAGREEGSELVEELSGVSLCVLGGMGQTYLVLR